MRFAFKTLFISSHFFGKNGAENLALRDQGLCVAARLFAEEKCSKLVQTSDVNNVMVSDRKGASTWKSAPKNDKVRNALNSDWLEIR